ncbi:hypothetical protein GCM10010247_50030 [Streptomyces calvus]|nr:hypothetical protein GCM10010247_50030 [Streptomyces calvus]
MAGLGGDHQRAVGAERVEQRPDDRDRPAVDPAEGAERGVHEEALTGPDTELAQLRGECVAGHEWAGGRGYGHGPGVFRTPLPCATDLIDQRSFPQVRLGIPK